APEIAGDAGGVLATTGAGLAGRDDAVVALRRLRAFGYATLSFTLHGLEAHHDWFVGRKGAFQALMTANRHAVAAGLGVHWNVFLDRRNLPEIPELLARGREEFGITAWLDIPAHRVSARLWRYESLRPDLQGVQRLLSQLDAAVWEGPLKNRPLDAYTEGAWLQAWQRCSDMAAFRHPFEPPAWPPAACPEHLVCYLMPERQLFLEPMCGAWMPLGILPATPSAAIARLHAVDAPPYAALRPADARLPERDSDVLHTQGYSVRYKAISTEVFGDQ
ncbi:MAG TPA: hypothetical protein PLZ36_13070, partial [Armatimonadota bacterium]|nr:hypothetical protein [Armatimonadota bacterium]